MELIGLTMISGNYMTGFRSASTWKILPDQDSLTLIDIIMKRVNMKKFSFDQIMVVIGEGVTN